MSPHNAAPHFTLLYKARARLLLAIGGVNSWHYRMHKYDVYGQIIIDR